MDKAEILRLLDEANDIVSALYRQGANKDYKCKVLREKLKAITAEIGIPPKSNADRIRAMTDEELARVLVFRDCANDLVVCPKMNQGNSCIHSCTDTFLEWLKQEVKDDDKV